MCERTIERPHGHAATSAEEMIAQDKEQGPWH